MIKMNNQQLKRLVIVTEFESKNFFQWHIALSKFADELGIILTSVKASRACRRIYVPFSGIEAHPYWNPIREADLVLVYVTRIDKHNTWWKLPQFTKQFMRPEAKMIVQYDDEFMWLFDPEHVWWSFPNSPNYGGPEQFFKDTGILEVPDAHLSVLEECPYKKFTNKPIFKMILPQLERYKILKYSEVHKYTNIALMNHSILTASIELSLENVIRKKNYPVTVFFINVHNDTDYDGVSYCKKNKLPSASSAYGRMSYESYMDLMWRECSIGLDDSINYIGWSRFVMECALCYIPCVGSTPAVKDLFPELYTKPQDYEAQIALIEKLKTNKIFCYKMAMKGYQRCLEFLDSKKLCYALMNIFDGIQKT